MESASNNNQIHSLQSEKNFIIKRYPNFILVIFVIYLYVLFAPSRVKTMLSIVVDGKNTTNEVWIIPFLVIVLFFFEKKNQVIKSLNKNNILIAIYLFILTIIICFGGFHTNSIIQLLYAYLILFLPILLFFIMSRCSITHIKNLIKFFVFVCLVYALFSIILSTNYAFFMEAVGNNIDNYRYYTSQYRASMMLGSSITVSYFFNLTLPMCFYLYFTSNEKIWRVISGLAIVIIIIATFILLSRMAALCTILIVAYSLIFIKGKKKSRKMGVFFLIALATTYAYQNFDLSRITKGINLSGSSAEARLEASSLGIYIFYEYPLLGSGLGTYFTRVYDDRFITFKGITGLVDPHNMYVLILSELGLIGLLIILLLFFNFFMKFLSINNKALRHTSILTLLVFLFDAFGGSHLFNEISLATIFWIYMGLFYVASVKFSAIKEKVEP